jgi:hypothetical protein
MPVSSCQRAMYGLGYRKRKHSRLKREVAEVERLRNERDYWRDRAIELEKLFQFVEEDNV